MAESNLSSYERAVVGQAILQRLNALNDALHDETYATIPIVREKIEQEYQTLNSAARKLKIHVEKEVEGLE